VEFQVALVEFQVGQVDQVALVEFQVGQVGQVALASSDNQQGIAPEICQLLALIQIPLCT
jgi:hypothetical protein